VSRSDPHSAPGAADEDTVAVFQIDGQPVRGRVVRLGPAMEAMLGAHDYPEPVARLLGEAALIAVMIGDSLKFDGRLILQATGDGPLSFVVADYHAKGAMRAYAKIDLDRTGEINGAAADGLGALIGQGTMTMTLDQGPDMDRYQGIVPLEGDTLTEAAEGYFAQSEQVPTRIRTAVGRWTGEGDAAGWRGGGMILQQVAGDDARGDSEDAWVTARTLFETVRDDELFDPALSGATVLYRLFHEEGVRLHEAKPVAFECRCSRETIKGVLRSFSEEERETMIENGEVTATCEYCNTRYVFEPSELNEDQARQ